MLSKGVINMELGRPKLWSDPKELEKLIDDYFIMCDEKGKPYTMSGLALAIGCDRRTLINYGNDEDFFLTIKKARDRVENFAEEKLYDRNVPTVGVIFNLKNNWNWVDKQEIDANVDNDVNIKVDLTDE